MAAETLARAGVQVDVYEQHRSAGRKFVLAGRSGLNLTNDVSLDRLIDRIDDTTGTIAACVEDFSPADIQAWSAELGEPTFVGSSGRVFPESFRATPLLRSWLRRLDELGVMFHTGVAVHPLRSANAGLLIDWSAPLLDRFEGTPVKGVRASWGDQEAAGDLMITRAGLEGTPVYSLAARINRDLAAGSTHALLLDLAPDRDLDNLAAHLASARRERDSFATWMRRARLASVTISLVREVTANTPPTDPAALATLLKALPVPVAGVAPLDRAISTSGGVDLTAVDADLQLNDVPGVFVAGEMLDADVPTGGWLLQVAFSTGKRAASGALAFIGNSTG